MRRHAGKRIALALLAAAALAPAATFGQTTTLTPGNLTAGSSYTLPFSWTNAGTAAASVNAITLTLDPAYVLSTNTAPGGAGWTCTVASQTVTCSAASTLTVATKTATPPVDVTFQVAATAASGTHAITVDTAPASGATTYNYSVIPAPSLGAQLTYYVPPGTSVSTMNVTVSSLNQDTLTGTFAFTATLPTGYTFNGSFVGPAWSCAPGGISSTVSCQTGSSTVLSAATPLQLSLSVVVGLGAANATLSATVSAQADDGDGVIQSLTAPPATTNAVVSASALTVNVTHQLPGNSTTGGPVPAGAPFTILVQVSAAPSTLGEALQFTDNVDSRLIISGTPSGTNWTCTTQVNLVTCGTPTSNAGSAPVTGVVSIPVTAAQGSSGASITNTVNATLAFFNGSLSPGSDQGTASDSISIFTAAQFGLAATHTPTGGAAGGPIPAGGSGTETIVATNAGTSAFVGQLTITDVMPVGLAAGTVAGTQEAWTCTSATTGTSNTQTITCTAAYTSASPLAVGGSPGPVAFPITVASTATGSVSNAPVLAVTNEPSGGTTNVAATDVIPVPAPAQVGIVTTHTPTGGSAGGAVPAGTGGMFTITVSNKGSSAIASGTLTVTDQVTQFLTVGALSASQPPWTCTSSGLPATGQTVTCSALLAATTSLTAGGTMTPIVIPFSAPSSDGPGPVTTLAGVTYAPPDGAAVTASVNDVVQILGPPPLSLTAVHTPAGGTAGGSLAPGGTGVLMLTAGNAGTTAITSGTLTVTETLTQFLTLGALPLVQGPWTCAIAGTQAVGQTVTCTDTVTAANPVAAASTLAPISIPFSVPANAGGGAITTTGQFILSAAGVSPAPVVAADAIQVVVPPVINVTASHTPASVAIASAGVITLTATNASSGPLAGTFTITDTLPAGISQATNFALQQGPWTCVVLPSGPAGTPVQCTAVAAANPIGSNLNPIAPGAPLASVSLPFAVSPTAAVGPVTNNVTASFTGSSGTATATTSDSIAVAAAATLVISATHTPSSLAAGGTGTLTLTVSNPTTAALQGNFSVNDALPAGISVSGTPALPAAWACPIFVGQNVTCSVTAATLAASGAQPFVISIPVTVAAGAAASVTNAATASFTPSGGTTSTATTNDVIPVQATNIIGLALTHVPTGGAAGGAVAPGATGTIMINASNISSSALLGSFTVTDQLNASLTIGTLAAAQAPWTCSAAGQMVTCAATVTSLAAGANAGVISIPFTLASSATGSIANAVNISFTPQGSTAATATAQASDSIQTQTAPSLSLNLSASSASLQAGSTGTFTAKMTNTGAAAIGSLTLTVNLDPSLAFIASQPPSGTDWTCQAPAGSAVTCTTAPAFSLAPGASSATTLTIPVYALQPALPCSAGGCQSVVLIGVTAPGAAAQQSSATVVVTPLAITLTAPSSAASEGQPTVTLASPQVAGAVTGCLVLSFAPGSGVAAPMDDPTVALALSNPFFTAGGTSRAATFTLAAGAATSQNVTVSLGSTAGAVTLSVYALAPGASCPAASGATPAATAQIAVAAAAPVVQGVTLARSGNTLTVTVTAFANTRDLSSAAFTFTAASGAAIQNGNSTITTNIGSLATPYFASAAGGAFIYTQSFNLTAAATEIASVAVTLTSSAGTSNSAAGQ